MNKTYDIVTPTDELICKNNRFSTELEIEEEGLQKLFNTFPDNTDESIILIKTVALNNLYHTRIKDRDLHIVVKKIKSIKNFDERVQSGDISLVQEICKINNINNPYSFATKYCSWHNPSQYPIVDGYVKAYLYYLNQQDHFYGEKFTQNDLLSYEKYTNIYNKFIKYYKLASDVKEIDKYIWKYAKKKDTTEKFYI